MQAVQKRVAHQLLRPSQLSNLNTKFKSGQGRQRHSVSAASLWAAAAVIFAFSVASACAAQPYSLGTWSTAVLRQPGFDLASTTLPNVGLAFFAAISSSNVDIFNATSRRWSTAALSVARGVVATSLPNFGVAIFAGGTTDVDIFNVTSGTWSTAKLSEARYHLAATSLPNHGLAIFAGGSSACRYMLIFDALRLYWFMMRMLMWGQ